MAPNPPKRYSWLWLLLPVLLACGWFWPVLQHGFRSDDFLAVYYYDRDAGAVQWSRVAGEWLRPWFGVRDLYRPLVSLSYGLNWWCSTQAFGFHLLNLGLLLLSATATAAVAARLLPQRPRLAGLLAAAVVVLHPAAVEPTAWIAARTTGLQVACSSLAMLGYLRWRDGAASAFWHLLAVFFACASKEGAVLLPASLLLLELLRGGRPRWLALLPTALLVIGYLLFRRCLLGCFTTAEEGHTLLGRLTGGLGLLQQLWLPPTGAAGWSVVCLAGGAGLLLLCSLLQRQLWRWLLVLPWLLLLLLPGTTHLQASGGALAGRFVYDAVPALALLLAALATAGKRLLPWRIAVALLWLLGAASASRAELQTYSDQDAELASLQQQLLRVAAAAQPAAPLGVVGLPKLPLLQPALWGFLTQRPFASVDLPVVGLENLLAPDPSTPLSFARPLPLHVLVAAGAGAAVWQAGSRQLLPLPAPAMESTARPMPWQQSLAAPQQFLPPGLVPATAVAALQVVLPGAAREFRVQVLGNLDGPYAAAPWQGAVPTSADGEVQPLWLDATAVLPWLVATTLGAGVAGVEVWIDGQPAPVGTKVFAHARLDDGLPVASPAQPVGREELTTWLQPPAGGADELHLLLPTGCYAMAVADGATLQLAAGLRQQLDFVCDVLGPCRVYWFFARQSGPAGLPQRSRLGSAIVR